MKRAFLRTLGLTVVFLIGIVAPGFLIGSVLVGELSRWWLLGGVGIFVVGMTLMQYDLDVGLFP